MSLKYGPESICADLKDPHPEKPGPDLKVGTGKASVDGYTALARRPRSAIPGEWVDNDTADRIENYDDSIYGVGQIASEDY